MVAAVNWPLQALRAPIVAYDGYMIWTLHSLMVHGGHGTLHAGLTNPVYSFSNPGYPLLVPASGATGYAAAGTVSLRLATAITAILNACALATLGCGLCALSECATRISSRVIATMAAICLCLIGFGLSGVYGVGGYADLLWAASAAAAVLWGLVLPLSGRHLAIAWVLATVAGLTKNEGFITACIILLLVSIRYLPVPSRSINLPRHAGPGTQRDHWLSWTWWLAKVFAATVLLALPGILWDGYVKYAGIGSDFVGHSGQPLALRFHATVNSFWAELHVVPLAMGVALVAAFVLRSARTRIGAANDLWLWIVLLASLVAVGITYVFGALEIHWWLSTSASRTTIFAALTAYADLAVWLVVATAREPEVSDFPERPQRP